MEHIKLASQLGAAAAFAKFAEDYPHLAKMKKEANKLLQMLGTAGLGAGMQGANHLGLLDPLKGPNVSSMHLNQPPVGPQPPQGPATPVMPQDSTKLPLGNGPQPAQGPAQQVMPPPSPPVMQSPPVKLR